jgi:hypothetical protein
VHPDGSVDDTVNIMKRIVLDKHKDVQRLANYLHDADRLQFCLNVFDFVMRYVAYERDSAFTEQLRTPLRTLHDQKGDCDCMSILIGSILHCKGVPFSFRITKYNVGSDFSHVYVVADGGILIDPVYKVFNKEKEYTDKKDYPIKGGIDGIPVQVLDGVEAGYNNELDNVLNGIDLQGVGLGSIDDDERKMYNYLVRTRNLIRSNPQRFKSMRNPIEVSNMLDLAIKHWYSNDIEDVLKRLEEHERASTVNGTLNLSGQYVHVEGLGGFYGFFGALGFLKKIKKTAKKVGGAVKKAAQATGRAIATAAKKTVRATRKVLKKTGRFIKKAVKKLAHVVMRFNPVSIAIRGGLLLAISKNMFKLADKLQYGLITEEQAMAAGLDMDAYRAAVDKYKKTRHRFVNQLRGKESKFNGAIRKGVKDKAVDNFTAPKPIPEEHVQGDFTIEYEDIEMVDTNEPEMIEVEEEYDRELDGFLGRVSQLGELFTAATITAATPVIMSVLMLFKGGRNPKGGAPYPDTPTREEIEQALRNLGAEMPFSEDQIEEMRVEMKRANDAHYAQQAQSNNLLNRVIDSKFGQGVQKVVDHVQPAFQAGQQFLQQQGQQQTTPDSLPSSSAAAVQEKTFIQKNGLILAGVAALLLLGGGFLMLNKKK